MIESKTCLMLSLNNVYSKSYKVIKEKEKRRKYEKIKNIKKRNTSRVYSTDLLKYCTNKTIFYFEIVCGHQ